MFTFVLDLAKCKLNDSQMSIRYPVYVQWMSSAIWSLDFTRHRLNNIQWMSSGCPVDVQ